MNEWQPLTSVLEGGVRSCKKPEPDYRGLSVRDSDISSWEDLGKILNFSISVFLSVT